MPTEQIDVRAYAETRGISREEAAIELGLERDGDESGDGHNPGRAVWPGASVTQQVAEHVVAAAPHLAAGFGHNSGAQVTAPDASALTMAARDKLRQVVARVNKLEEEKKEVAEQIKDVFQEAKSMGYDTKALRKVIREMNQDRQEREEQEAILDVYRDALGMYE